MTPEVTSFSVALRMTRASSRNVGKFYQTVKLSEKTLRLLMTLSYTELEHAQLHQHMPVEWVWSINHRYDEQKLHDL